jgi:hypothetical protein
VQTRAGLICELARGPGDGVIATIVLKPEHSEAQLEAAKREIRRTRDVVLLAVRRDCG